MVDCVICLAAQDADRVCHCSAMVCRGCLSSLIDRGRTRCAVCGSRYQPSAVVKACLFGLDEPASSQQCPAKAYIKLGLAYSAARRPRSALRALSVAQQSVVPDTHLHFLCMLETARNRVRLGDSASAEGGLELVISKLLDIPNVGSAVLVA